MTINHILYVMDEYVLTLAHIVRISTGLTEFNDLSCHSVPPLLFVGTCSSRSIYQKTKLVN